VTWNPHPEQLRIGTAEREQALAALGEHLAAGRLDPAAYNQRMSHAAVAQNVGELRAIFADLPAPHPVLGSYTPDVTPVLVVPGLPVHPPGVSDKSKVVAGLLQIIPGFGVGRFYTGHVGIGVAQLLVTFFTLGFGGIWPLIDGIIILVNGGTDASGRPLRN
jgi:TM2 domain-containing membrane protein YozV